MLLQLPHRASSRATRPGTSRPDTGHGCHLQGGSFLVPTLFISCWSPSPGLGDVLVLLEPSKHAAHEIWTCITTNTGLTCPFLKRQRKQLSFYFQGATAAGTEENRGGNTFLKPFPETFAICMLLDDGPCPHAVWFWEQISGISHFCSSQESNIFQPVFVSINYLPTGYRSIRNPTVHNS